MSEYQQHTPKPKDGPFLKLKEKGDKVVIRTVTLPYREPKIWREVGQPPVSNEEMLEYTPQDWADVYREPDYNVQEVYHWPCIDRESNRAKLYTGTPGIFSSLKELDANENWGDPRTYDIQIERTEEPGKGYYKVTPLPNKNPITQKELEQLKTLELDKLIPAARRIDKDQIDKLDEAFQDSPADDGNQAEQSGYEKAKAVADSLGGEVVSPDKPDVVIEDIGDEPINLDDIPF